VTSHERSHGPKGTAVTKPEHRPQSHREWGDWPAERLVGWAQTKGAKTGEVAAAILERGQHPESGRRACLKLVRMGERHGSERLEAACGRALAIGNPTARSVEAILKSGLEKMPLAEEVEPRLVAHENIRGGDYFDRGEAAPSREEEEIEARYLEEERQAIIHELRADESTGKRPRRRTEDTRSDGVSHEVAGSVVVPVVTRTAEPLSALIGRAQAALSRLPVVKPIGRRGAGDRGGEDIWSGGEIGSSCASQSVCIDSVVDDEEALRLGEDVSNQEWVCDEMTCEVDDGWDASCGPRRGEV
jgi:hypothetical protein